MEVLELTPDGFRWTERGSRSPGRGELVVTPTAVGVCESDVATFRERATAASPPVVLGHEATGVVVAAGPGVDGPTPGTRVATLATSAFAERVVVPADQVVAVPDDLADHVALGEPVACVAHALGRSGIAPGHRVAVVGCGFMGLVALALARERGATVTALEPIAARRVHAQRLGAAATVDPSGHHPSRLDEELGRFDVVLEVVGNQAALDAASALVREHGRLVVIAYHHSGGGRRSVDLQQWNYRAIDVVNGHVRDVARKVVALHQAMDLLAAGVLDLAPLVTTWPLDDVDDALAAAHSRPEDVVKAVVVPSWAPAVAASDRRAG